MSKPVALLDVDHTLLFDNRLNTTLLNQLKAQGIKDIYLFTDMTLQSSTVKDRINLINLLKKEGFTVHGVITPLDLIWDKLPSDKMKDFKNYLMEHGPKKFHGEDFDVFLEKLPQEYNFIQKALMRPLAEVKFGSAFVDAVEGVSHVTIDGGRMPDNLNEKGDVAKIFGDILGSAYSHTKGLLLQAFIENKPGWVSSVVVADDNEHVIQSIEEYRRNHAPNIPVSVVKVANEGMEAHEYEKILKNHVTLDTDWEKSKMFDKIDEHIKALKKTRRNPFLTSPTAKISALVLLKDNLSKADLSLISVDDVIKEWRSNIAFEKVSTKERVATEDVISQHRNIFKSEYNSKKDTSTQDFIKKFKDEFGTLRESNTDDPEANDNKTPKLL